MSFEAVPLAPRLWPFLASSGPLFINEPHRWKDGAYGDITPSLLIRASPAISNHYGRRNATIKLENVRAVRRLLWL